MDTFQGRQNATFTLHKYLYANVSPANMIDPTGNTSLMSLGVGVSVVGTLTLASNIGITFLGGSLASEDADNIPDAFIMGISGFAGTGGALVEAGGDAIYDRRSGRWYGYGFGGVGVSPLSFFRNHRIGLSASAGLIWNLSSPNDWSGPSVTANWPVAILTKLPAAAFNSQQMYNALTSLAIRSRSPRFMNKTFRNFSAQVGVSSGGPVSLRLAARSNSFGATAGYSTEPRDITADFSRFTATARSIVSDFGNALDLLQ